MSESNHQERLAALERGVGQSPATSFVAIRVADLQWLLAQARSALPATGVPATSEIAPPHLFAGGFDESANQ